MTTTSDFKMLMTLRDNFTPAQHGILNPDEIKKIHETLELSQRSDIELQNIRDMTVMLYGNDANQQNNTPNAMRATFDIMNAMSSITMVIDTEKARRGLEV